MLLRYVPYSLELKEPFGTAHGTRTHTDGMLVAIESGGLTGYGEVFMPPYYPENQESMAHIFESVDVSKLLKTESLTESLIYLQSLGPGNHGAKAALDIAVHDLDGKRNGRSVSTRYSTGDGNPRRFTSFTIGVDSISTMVRKAKEARGFNSLKIKLNGTRDVHVIEAIREVTDQELLVDANQGWDDLDDALETAHQLIDLGVGLIEQPFKQGEHEKAGALAARCAVPLIADEDIQTLEDIDRLAPFYDGINVKLMKAGGIEPAVKMISRAREKGLKVLIGCMTESSIGISAAAQISHLADWLDLDGNLLIKNDTCTAVQTIDGDLVLSEAPGIGITDDSNLIEIFS